MFLEEISDLDPISQGKLIDPTGKRLSEDSLEPKAIKSIEASYNKLLAVQDELKRFPELAKVPSLRTNEEAQPEPGRGKVRVMRAAQQWSGDNSNTQFAALGLWVASRHDVPCDMDKWEATRQKFAAPRPAAPAPMMATSIVEGREFMRGL